MIDERALNIYTDGSSKPHPRRGGVGIRYVYVNDEGAEVCENLPRLGYKGVTSNEMELSACIIALQNSSSYLLGRHFTQIIIYSDSEYVVSNYKNAMFLWPKTRWTKKEGGPVLNAPLWKDLVKAIRKAEMKVEFKKVKAHGSDEHNKAVDRLAKQSAASPINRPLAIRTVRRKRSKQKTRIGCILMIGQRFTIRIIEGQYLSVQRLYRYRYEVVSRKSTFRHCVDFACSSHILREGHIYSVRMNCETKNPCISKVFKEIKKDRELKITEKLLVEPEMSAIQTLGENGTVAPIEIL